jgi:hypothetical protein
MEEEKKTSKKTNLTALYSTTEFAPASEQRSASMDSGVES